MNVSYIMGRVMLSVAKWVKLAWGRSVTNRATPIIVYRGLLNSVSVKLPKLYCYMAVGTLPISIHYTDSMVMEHIITQA